MLLLREKPPTLPPCDGGRVTFPAVTAGKQRGARNARTSSGMLLSRRERKAGVHSAPERVPVCSERDKPERVRVCSSRSSRASSTALSFRGNPGIRTSSSTRATQAPEPAEGGATVRSAGTEFPQAARPSSGDAPLGTGGAVGGIDFRPLKAPSKSALDSPEPPPAEF